MREAGHTLCQMSRCLVLAALVATSAHADVCEPVLRYLCDPAADNLIIGYKTTCNEELEAVQYTDQPHAGVYQPSERVQKACNLSSGVHVTLLEPFIFNEDPRGECGAAMSAFVTISKGAKILMKKTSFILYDPSNLGMGHGFCLADEEIREIRFSGEKESPEVQTGRIGF
jgi:hypothetical protein